MSFKINKFLLLPVIFLFMPSFVFYVPALGSIYLWFFIILYIFLFLLIFLDNTKIISKFKEVIKTTPLKYYMFCLLFMILNSLFLVFCGSVSKAQIIRSIIMQIGLFILPILIYFTYIIDKYISYENFMRFFIILFWCNLVLGFVCYLGQLFSVDIINNIISVFINKRSVFHGITGIDSITAETSNYVAFNMPRLSNLFEEPSYYGIFLTVFMPLIYSISSTTSYISKNKNLNFIIKMTLIPFTWLNLILTLSPIYLIFGILITTIFYFKEIILLFKKYFIYILPLLFIFFNIIVILSLFNVIDLSNTYLSRIQNILVNINNLSIDKLIEIESSLAERIITYINMLCVFFNHIYTGVGFGHLSQHLQVQLIHSPVPLTIQMYTVLRISMQNGTPHVYTPGFIYILLAEHGLFIFSLFAYFNYQLYKAFNYFIDQKKLLIDDILYKSLVGLKFSFIGIIITYLYNSAFTQLEIYMYYFMSIALIYKLVHTEKTGGENENTTN